MSWRLLSVRALRILVSAAALALVGPAIAWAQLPIRIIVPYGPGGTQDAMARLLARHMAEGLKQPVIVENRPGGSSLIGTRLVVQSAPDGRTLLLAGAALAAMPATHQLDFDPQRDLLPVIKVATTEVFLVAHGGLQLRSVEDLKRLARQRPAGINCAGLPGPTTLACERLRLLLDANMVTIPFQSLAPALNALVAGHVDVMFSPRPGIVSLVAGNQLTILAATTESRPTPPFEGTALAKDIWPDLVLDSSSSIFAPAGTPAAVIAALNREINRILAIPEVRPSLTEQSFIVLGGTEDSLSKDLAREIAFYRRIGKEAGIKPEPIR